MDVIAQVIAAVLAFFVGIIGNIFAHDICASANSVCAKIIKAAAARLALFEQHSTEQVWLADLHEHQTVFEKYRHAVGCFLAAPKMRRYALEAPFVAGAPGLVWRQRRRDDGNMVWEARWQAPHELVKRGLKIKSCRLWTGYGFPTAEDKEWIKDRTLELQAELDQWARGDRSG